MIIYRVKLNYSNYNFTDKFIALAFARDAKEAAERDTDVTIELIKTEDENDE